MALRERVLAEHAWTDADNGMDNIPANAERRGGQVASRGEFSTVASVAW